jgi:hypothetical protein
MYEKCVWHEFVGARALISGQPSNLPKHYYFSHLTVEVLFRFFGETVAGTKVARYPLVAQSSL